MTTRIPKFHMQLTASKFCSIVLANLTLSTKVSCKSNLSSLNQSQNSQVNYTEVQK